MKQYFKAILLIMSLLSGLVEATTDTLTASGTWTVPAGVTSVTVEAWGGGGAGGGATGNPAKGGGGAGGQYARSLITVVPGNIYAVTVGAGGLGSTGNGTAGGDSIFATNLVVARGGAPGTGATNGVAGSGSTVGGVGDVVYSGGNGSNGNSTGVGGAGGGGAGSNGAGGNATGNTAGVGATTGGGNGGAGLTSRATGNAGAVAGGGGGGGYATNNTDRNGGAGARGQVSVSYFLPIVTTNAATPLTSTGATLNGTVSSNGSITTVTFNYGLTTGYGSTATATASPLAAGATNSAVSVAVTGLACNTLYHFRVSGANSSGTSNGGDLTFTTAACLPTVATNAATALSHSGATLNGTVSSNGGATTVSFEYGLTGAYGTTIAATQSPLAAGATNSAVSAAVSGLVCETLYHYRANGTNIAGTSNGVDRTFTTSTCPPPVVTLGKTAGTSAAAVDSYVTYELTATNSTPGALNNVVLTDVIPATMTYTTNAATLGTVNVVGQTLTWTIPYLPSGGSAQLTLVVQPTAQGTYTNTVTSPGATPASADILILPSAITRYSMDEDVGSWTGATGEVIDSGGNGLSGRRRTTTTPTTTNTVAPSPTIASQHASVVGGYCNAGSFDGRAVVESASSTYFQFGTRLSASAWIYPTSYPTYPPSDLYSILSNDVNYEFHLNGAGQLFWWWQADTLTSAATIPLNQWTHIAITFDSTPGNRRQRIYINGVQDVNTNNWTGTLATNACPFYIGGDIATGTGCALMPERNFHGLIDEAKIYDYELTAAEVQADMNLGRLCGASSFDHIQIEHDGTASTCAPETVTVKACMNASCSSLYPGTVTVHLSPTGWISSDILTINGGVATATLNNSAISVPSLTLGTTSVSPSPSGATRCFNGATETCTLSVGATDCSFDAVEVGANPRTHLFTKLAGTAFNVDVVAVGTPVTTVDTTKNTTVSVDLVDTSSVACSSTSTALNTAQPVTLVAGRRTVSMSCAAVAPNAQVRIRIGSAAPYTYACSYDKFAVRPSAAILNSTNTLATPPSPSDANTIPAGGSFNLGATTAPTGYAGVLTLVPGALTAQLPSNVSAQISGGTVGALALTPFTVNTVTYNSAIQANTAQGGNATYSEVGYFYANPGTFRDTGFTSVDQINQLANCAATDTCDCLLSTSATNGSVPNNLSDVLINGRYGCYIGNKTGFAFGRFIPDHFDTAIGAVAGVPMPCPTGQTCPCPFGSICPPTASTGFVYSGQNFTAQVMARSLAGGTTLNYYGNYAHAVTLGAWDAPGSTATSNPNGSLTNTAILAATFGAGVATTTTDRPVYTLATVATAPTDIYLRAVESAGGDGVTSLRAINPISTSVEGGVRVLVGRMRVSSAYGSEQLPLPLSATVQYWNGTNWLTSATDNVTSFNPATDLVATIRKGPLLVSNIVVANIGSVAVAGGQRSFTVNRPGVAGSADLLLGGGTAPSYLLTGSNGAAVNPGAPGRVTFGVYKGANQFIYMREAY